MKKFWQTQDKNLLLRYYIVGIFLIPVVYMAIWWIAACVQTLFTGSDTIVLHMTATNILKLLRYAAELYLFASLLYLKLPDMNRTSRAGAWIMVVYILILYVNLFIMDRVNEAVRIAGESDPSAYAVLGLASVVPQIIYMVGMFMFIAGCNVGKKLRRFVKWTIFIPLIVGVCSSLAAFAIGAPDISLKIQRIVVGEVLPVLFLLIVYKLSGVGLPVKYGQDVQ